MINDLMDSRALGRTNCYAQRFMKGGRYRYNIVPAHTGRVSREAPFTISVGDGERAKEANQHLVQFGFGERGFETESRGLAIAAGDIVLWNCTDEEAPAFAVIGEREFFASDRMANECGFTHVFGLPGEIEWGDANGSALSGRILVRNPEIDDEAGLKRWQRDIGKGALVMIEGEKAKPSKIEVLVGQQLFFAVVKAPGVSITDKRLLDEAPKRRPEGGAAKRPPKGRKAK